MSWKKIAAVAGASVAALAAFVLLTGFRGACGWGRHRTPADVQAFVDGRVMDALGRVDATPEQRAQVKQIVDRVVADGLKLRDSHGDLHRELVAQWDAATPDAAQVHALVDQRVDAMRALAHEAADAAIQVHGILTPEQRAKVSQRLHEHDR
jgi:protein CpxP